MRSLVYPLLRIYRRTLYIMKRGSVSEYNDAELASVIAQGDLRLWESKEKIGCLLTAEFLVSHPLPEQTGPVPILDFGGGGGRHGFELCRTGSANWIVVETPALAAAASATLAETGITFVSQTAQALEKVNKFGIVHVSSSLQYTAEPLQVLQELLALKSTYIVFEKLVLTSRPNVVRFHQYSLLGDNMIKPSKAMRMWATAVRYPLTALPYEEFIATLESDYQLLEKLQDSIQSHLPLFKGLGQYSFVAKHREA